MRKNAFFKLAAIGITTFLAACNGASSGGGTSGSGSMSLAVTDAPVDQANAVVVQFSGVALKPAIGEEIIFNFDAPRTIDLLRLQRGNSADLLDNQSVPAGRYESMRLLVNAQRNTADSYIVLADGSQHSLFIPSGSQAGLRLVSGFTVPLNGSASFTIDFDLRKSVVSPQAPGSDFFLRPTLRIVDNGEVGNIAGTIDAATLGDVSCRDPDPAQNSNIVYVFAGADVAPDDVDGGIPDPVTTARAGADNNGLFTYRAAFLPPGDYTIAFTCQAADDEPDREDALVFLGTRTVTVAVNTTTAADF